MPQEGKRRHEDTPPYPSDLKPPGAGKVFFGLTESLLFGLFAGSTFGPDDTSSWFKRYRLCNSTYRQVRMR